jgi:TetR/AcrR family transcriptional regulator, transcriptional repressor for nem operon
MGIAGASLYNAYGGKRALFAAALDHYCNHSMIERIRRLEANIGGLAAIEAFFEDIIERSIEDSGRKGCFLVNAALETAPHDRELAVVISGYFSELKGFFRRSIVAGQAIGEIDEAIDPDEYSGHLLALLVGTRLLARCNPDRALLEAGVSPALQHLHPPTPERKDPI